MTLTCYIVDDDNYAIEAIVKFIHKTPELRYLGGNINPISALQEIKELKPNILFLDIEMPEMSGLELADLIPKDISIIFTTSHSQYAIQAFEKDAIHYLLKPFSFHNFTKAVQKVYLSYFGQIGRRNNLELHQLLIKVAATNKIVQIDINKIVFVEALNHYIFIHTQNEKFISHIDMADIDSKLRYYSFLRIHRKYIINTLEIISIESGSVYLRNGIEIPIGEAYKKAFWEKVSPRILKKK